MLDDIPDTGRTFGSEIQTAECADSKQTNAHGNEESRDPGRSLKTRSFCRIRIVFRCREDTCGAASEEEEQHVQETEADQDQKVDDPEETRVPVKDVVHGNICHVHERPDGSIDAAHSGDRSWRSCQGPVTVVHVVFPVCIHEAKQDEEEGDEGPEEQIESACITVVVQI